MKKKYQELYEKIIDGNSFNDDDWYYLWELYDKPFLFNKKLKMIQKVMTEKLFSEDAAQLTGEIKFIHHIISLRVSKENIAKAREKRIAFCVDIMKNFLLYFCVALLAVFFWGLNCNFTPGVETTSWITFAPLLVILAQNTISIFRERQYKYKTQRIQESNFIFSRLAAHIIFTLFVIVYNKYFYVFEWGSYVFLIAIWCIHCLVIMTISGIHLLFLHKKENRYLSYVKNLPLNKITKEQWDELYCQMEAQKDKKIYDIGKMPILKNVMHELLTYDFEWAVGLSEQVPAHIKEHPVYRYFHNFAMKAFDDAQVSAQNHFDTYCHSIMTEKEREEREATDK